MMNCLPLKDGPMLPDAEKVCNATQNNSLSPLDQVVREAIQNSLDAVTDENQQRSVPVRLYTGDFQNEEFADLLGEPYSGCLKQKNFTVNHFLAISDRNTTGLSGDPFSSSSNYNKLVFGFLNGKKAGDMKSGGSYGLGKTVYLQLGLGFVIYYSRISPTESRLGIFFCQSGRTDQIFPVELLPKGIAWWGNEFSLEGNFISPVTNEEYIRAILNIFHLLPYDSDKTGTTVIIPFVDFEKQLENIRIACQPLEGEAPPFWTRNISFYLQYSVLKWYAPRLRFGEDIEENRVFHFGRYLSCSVFSWQDARWDGANCLEASFASFFQEIRSLYDTAWDKSLSFVDTDSVKKIPIKLSRKTGVLDYQDDEPFGWIVIKRYKFSAEELTPQVNEVKMVLASLVSETGSQKPRILVYCRRPGMILTYRDPAWNALMDTFSINAGEFLFGIFVVNSEKPVICRKMDSAEQQLIADAIGQIPLEQMFRASERGDHYGWPNDAKPYGFELMKVLRNRIKNELAEIEKADNPQQQKQDAADLSAFLGQMFSVPGKGSGNLTKDPAGNGNLPEAAPERPKGKRTSYKKTQIAFKEPSYFWDDRNGECVRVPFDLIVNKDTPEVAVQLAVAADTNSERYSPQDWSSLFTEPFPLEFCGCSLLENNRAEITEDGAKLLIHIPTEKNIKLENQYLIYRLKRNDVTCILSADIIGKDATC